MKQSGRLLNLIFNYYRENPAELGALLPLRGCQISRRWGTMKIVCPNQRTLMELLEVQDLLSRPLALMRIAKRVKLFFGGVFFQEFLVQTPSPFIELPDYNPQDSGHPINLDPD
jgi:hypothetical protein